MSRRQLMYLFLAFFVVALWIGLEVLRRQYENLREPMRRHRASPAETAPAVTPKNDMPR
jgi:hypothetical protein